MEQKVVAVNINRAAVKTGKVYQEMEFTQLNDYLAQGYKLVDTLKSEAGKDSHYFTITFILEMV